MDAFSSEREAITRGGATQPRTGAHQCPDTLRSTTYSLGRSVRTWRSQNRIRPEAHREFQNVQNVSISVFPWTLGVLCVLRPKPDLPLGRIHGHLCAVCATLICDEATYSRPASRGPFSAVRRTVASIALNTPISCWPRPATFPRSLLKTRWQPALPLGSARHQHRANRTCSRWLLKTQCANLLSSASRTGPRM